MPSAALITNPYSTLTLATNSVLDPAQMTAQALIGQGWNDAHHLIDGNPWSSWSPNYDALHTVSLDWGEAADLTTVSVLVQSGNGVGGQLEFEIAGQSYPLALDRTGWITLALTSPVSASSLRLTRDSATENITEIVLGATLATPPMDPSDPINPMDPVDPSSGPTTPTGEARRTVDQAMGTNGFPSDLPTDIAAMMRDLRPGSSLLSGGGKLGTSGQFDPEAARIPAYGYAQFNQTPGISFFPMIAGGPEIGDAGPFQGETIGFIENRLSDFDIPSYFEFADAAGGNSLAQSAYEQASAYDYHSDLMADIVGFYSQPFDLYGNGNLVDISFDYLEHWNEPNRLFEAGNKNNDLGWLTPGEYAAMASADYDAIKAVDADVNLVMGGLVFEWEQPGGWNDARHRWQAQPGETLPSWQDRPEQYDPLAWLNAVRDWSEVNRGPGELPFDVINLHAYAVNEVGGTIREGISPEDYGLEKALDAHDTWRDNYNADHGTDLELWLTEFGYSTAQPTPGSGFWQTHVADEATQGKWTLRSILAGLAQDVDVMTQYNNRDLGGSEWDRNTGISQVDGTPKQGRFAMARFREELAGMTFAGKVEYNGREGVNVYAFQEAGANRGAYVVWSGDDAVRDVAIALPNPSQTLTALVELEELNASNADSIGSIGDLVYSATGDELLLENVNGYPVILQIDALPVVDYVDPVLAGPIFGETDTTTPPVDEPPSGPRTYDLTTASGGWGYVSAGTADLLQINGFDPEAGDTLVLPAGVTSNDYHLTDETRFGGSLNGDGDTTDVVLSVWSNRINGFDPVAVVDGWTAWNPSRSLGAYLAA